MADAMDLKQSRKWLITINNPLDHGYDHGAIKNILSKVRGQSLYWCMCDEEGDECETLHTHIFLYRSSPFTARQIDNLFPKMHRDNCYGTAKESRAYVLKDGDKYNKQDDGSYRYTDSTGKEHIGINHSDTVKGQTIKLDKHYDYAYTVADRIKDGESPDAIVGDLKRQNQWTVSTPTLYRYIDLGFIPGITNGNLFQKSRKKKRTYRKPRAAKAPKGISIERRPEDINSRSTFGHWEMDLVIGKQQKSPLLVLTERKTRFEIIRKLPNKSTDSVTNAIDYIVNKFPYRTFQTITVDNGSEFADYQTMKLYTEEVYYCHPYCSSERGSNENANRIIRRTLPKGTDFRPLTQQYIDSIAYRMNNMHRKILGYHTAAELFAAELARL